MSETVIKREHRAGEEDKQDQASDLQDESPSMDLCFKEDPQDDIDNRRFVCGFCGLLFYSEEYLHHLDNDHGVMQPKRKPAAELKEDEINRERVNAQTMSQLRPSNPPSSVDLRGPSIHSDGSSYSSLNAGHTPSQKPEQGNCDNSMTDQSETTPKKQTEVTTKLKKVHWCDICKKAFAGSGDLKAHWRIHTGERPYKCEDCGRGFTQISSLQSHRKTHTGDKPHKCEVCGKAFAESSNLQKHFRIHTGVRPYKCDECGRTFSRSHHLTQHKRTH